MTTWMKCAASALLMAAITGCGSTKILDTKFDGSGSPAGSIPGAPSGDVIWVDNASEPELEGGFLYWRPPPHGKARFHSAAYTSPTKTKTIYWEGKRTGDTDFIFHIGAQDPGSGAPQYTLVITLRKTNAWGKRHVGPVRHSDNFDATISHSVFIHLYVDTGMYKIKISGGSPQPLVWEGHMESEMVNSLESLNKIVVQAEFKPESGPIGYRMDNMVMRQLE